MSFGYENGQMVIRYQNRRVATTGGTLLQFLTQEREFSTSLGYPDANKGEIYAWNYRSVRAVGDRVRFAIAARSVVGARPQEWATSIALGAAPSGADIFIGRAILSRTKAPSHAWIGQPIVPFQPQGVAIQINGGSMILEAVAGLCRAVSVYISGGQLIAYLQHSVGPAAGNFMSWGDMPPSYSSTSTGDNDREGGENTGTPAIPVYWSDAAPYYLQQEFTGEGQVGIGNMNSALLNANRTRQGQPNAATYSDPTDYSSIYSLTVRGRFGRRS